MSELTESVVPPGLYQRWIAVASFFLDGPVQDAITETLRNLYVDIAQPGYQPPSPAAIATEVSNIMKAMQTCGFDADDLNGPMSAVIEAFITAPSADPICDYNDQTALFAGLNSTYGTPEHSARRIGILFGMAGQLEAAGVLEHDILDPL